MTLLERLAALPSRGTSLLETPQFDQAIARVRNAFPDQRSVAPQDLDTLIRKLEFALSNKDWSSVKEGDVGVVVKAFAANLAPMPQSVRQFLWSELTQTTRTNLLSALCEGFMTSWAPRDMRIRQVAHLIIGQAGRLSGEFQKLFMDVPELLDVDRGATSFGQWMASQGDPHQAVLARGIPEPHSIGFMAHAHDAWLASLPPLTAASLVDHVLAWITPKDRGALAGDRAIAVVERLLQPWHSKMPSTEMRTKLVERLLAAYKDPRMENESFWSRISDSAKKVMLRWLAGVRMESFMEVVTLAEARGAHREQWAGRRNFWMGMYEQGRIDEAWVAYTNKARIHADELFKKTHDASYKSYGLQGSGTRNDTCLLIMRIGEKIVVEGSHNFRVHVFSKSHSRAPDLYLDQYDVDDFMLPRTDGRHTGTTRPGAGWVGSRRRQVELRIYF